MANIVAPTQAQLESLVAPYLATQPRGLGFAIGYASPDLANSGGLFFRGNVQNQFGTDLRLGATTPFEIASLTKTFTATLYALLIPALDAKRTVGDYISPKGPLQIGASLAGIKLDGLVNYTSGLPQDNTDAGADAVTPPVWPLPYSMQAVMSFLDASPPPVSPPPPTQADPNYTYSNLAFALMSAIIASGGTNRNPTAEAFASQIRQHVFAPLGLRATFFDEASLATLPLGYNYDYGRRPAVPYATTQPGWALFPAYFGAAGIVATPDDMFRWLLFNMGVTRDHNLTPLLPKLQKPSTRVRDDHANQLGLGWFINAENDEWSASVFKDGDLYGFSSYMAFLPSPDPGSVPSQAGAFVLVNGGGITATQTKDDDEVAAACALTNHVLQIMQGHALPADVSVYPRSAGSRALKR